MLFFKPQVQIDYDGLTGIWQNSYEESQGDTLVFRPEGYKLSHVRGREKLEFKNDFKFTRYQIAPTDGYLKLRGKYEIDKTSNEIVVEYNYEERIVQNTMTIHSLTKDKLVLEYKSKKFKH